MSLYDISYEKVSSSKSAFLRSGMTCGDTCTGAMTLWPFWAMPMAAASPKPEPGVAQERWTQAASPGRVRGSTLPLVRGRCGGIDRRSIACAVQV